jgi:molecular chaperone DnaK
MNQFLTESDSSTAFAQAPVGIDLGTTYSVVSYLDGTGRPTTIPNELGESLTPTAVLFEEEGITVGREAVRGSILSPDGFADCFKRDVGSPFFHRRIRGLEVPPEVLSGFALQQLKQDAERILGPVRQAVVTVPAFFDESRRKATQDAGRLAGLDVLDIINEPTAAALAFGYQQGLLNPVDNSFAAGPQRILVYDLGGGTFDVTIMEIDGNQFRTLATDGDVRLGGKDFDERLVDHIAEQFRTMHGIDPRSDPHDAAQLWLDAQQAKHTLSQRSKTSMVSAYGGVRMRVDLSRAEFDEITSDLLQRTETTTELVVRDAKLDWSQIDRVLLVGGSTRMPMVTEMLRRITGREPDRSASADEAVSHGAALYCGTLMQSYDKQSQAGCRLINVNSHSLGLVGIDTATRKRINAVVIPKNTPLPCRVVRSFVTERDNQRSVKIAVVEGESRSPEDCIYLGECVVRDLPEGLPKGTAIQVEYSYSANGRIAVSAKVAQARQSAQVEIDRRHMRRLEDLEVWNARLRGLVTTGEIGFGGKDDGPPVNLNDRSSVLRRLDYLFTRIGHSAARETLPKRLVEYQEAAAQTAKQLAEIQQQLAQAEEAKQRATGPSEARRYGSEHARLTAEFDNLKTQADFSYLVLGRECVLGNAVPESEKPLEQEAAQLRQHLA